MRNEPLAGHDAVEDDKVGDFEAFVDSVVDGIDIAVRVCTRPRVTIFAVQAADGSAIGKGGPADLVGNVGTTLRLMVDRLRALSHWRVQMIEHFILRFEVQAATGKVVGVEAVVHSIMLLSTSILLS